MTARKPTNPGIAEKIQAGADSAHPGTCPRCGAPVLRARAGRVAALDVIADPVPITPIEEILARLDGRLTWHLVTEYFGQRITWRHLTHIRAGPQPGREVIADHVCPLTPIQETLL